MINGRRIIPSERINLQGTPEEARTAIRAMAAKGIRHTGEIALTPEPGPTPHEIGVLKAVVEEGAKAGVQINVHAVSTPAMVAAIDAGVRRLVHLPNKDWASREAAEKVASTGSIVLGLIAFGAPIIDRASPPPALVTFPKDSSPRFRDGKPWPEAIAGANRNANGQATGTEAGYTVVNARTIWDASGGKALGYCTDQNYADVVVLEHELKSYSVMFSMQDIIRIMGPNTAEYLHMSDQIGTLESGKLADIILLDGKIIASPSVCAAGCRKISIRAIEACVPRHSHRSERRLPVEEPMPGQFVLKQGPASCLTQYCQRPQQPLRRLTFSTH